MKLKDPIDTEGAPDASLRGVWAQSLDGLRIIDEQGIIRRVNPAFCQMVGKARNELEGRPFPVIYDERYQTGMIESLRQQMLAGRVERHIEKEITLWDGKVVWLEITNSLMTGDPGGLRVLSIFRDITDRKRAEEAVRQTQKMESIGILAGGIAHDFNNLLNVILGQASLALEKLPHASAARAHVEKSVTAAERAAALTRQLLAYSGRGRFEVKPVSINRLIRENRQLFEASVAKNTKLELDLADPLPQIKADAGQIQQVLLNLLLNGSEAIAERQGKLSLITRIEDVKESDTDYWKFTGQPLAPARYVCIQVQDDGCGMNSETLERIFDPFFTTKFTGRGLGLPAVLGIVRSHGGGLDVCSAPGKGTRFRVVLPAIESVASSTEKQAPAHEARDGALRSVLIIDDERLVLELVKDICEMKGINALTAENGEEGLILYRRHKEEIALVLLDLSMPVKGGEETFRELREIDPKVRVILSSGYTEDEVSSRFVGMGLTGFIQKPYKPSMLVRKIEQCLK